MLEEYKQELEAELKEITKELEEIRKSDWKISRIVRILCGENFSN